MVAASPVAGYSLESKQIAFRVIIQEGYILV